MVINIFLAGLKLALGIFGGSQALVADAVHSFSDMSTDVAVLFGVKFWSAPPDESHPYGHKRIETLVTAAIGFFLGLVAIGIGYNALMSIWAEQAGQPSWVALIGALLSIVFKEFVYRWTVAVGKQVKSPAVVANAWHHRTDALSSIPVAHKPNLGLFGLCRSSHCIHLYSAHSLGHYFVNVGRIDRPGRPPGRA